MVYLNPKRAEFISTNDETTIVSCMLTTSACKTGDPLPRANRMYVH